MSILKGLKKIEDESLKSFHVPGHKNGRYLNYLPFANNLGYYDATEIEGTDNLHAPEDIIKDAQRTIANFYGAEESFILVNGSTGGILSMIYAAFTPGDKVIISRDAHKSVFTGLILAQLEPVYVTPEIDSQSGVSLGVSAESIKAAYKRHEDIKGLVITYPSYHGICTNLSAIEEIVHEASGVLLVDAAHGAHLNLGSELPKTAIELGADIVIQSTHKSLPALTQSALMHYCSSKVSLTKLKMALAMFQSSSPSYLLMASVENAVRVASDEGETLMADLLENIRIFSNALEKETKFAVLNERRLSKRREVDLTKITLLTQNTPYNGGALDTLLREKYSIQCEYGTDTAVLFITSIATAKEDLEALLSALKEISQEITSDEVVNKEDSNTYNEAISTFNFKSFELLQALRPSDAVHKERDLILLSNSIGEIAGDFVVPYPPGIPIIVPGEVISEQVVNYIEEGLRKGYNINGVFNCKIPQLNIIRR